MASSSSYNIKFGADTSEISSAIKKITGKTHTLTFKTDAEGVKTLSKEITRTTSTMSDGSKQVETLTKGLDKNGDAISTLTRKTIDGGKSVKTMGQAFVDTTAKVAKFYTSTMVIQSFTKMVSAAKDTIVEFDSSLVELRKVTDLGGDSLSKYKDNAYDLASELKTSATNVTDAVTEFSKSGYDLDESMGLAKSAMMFQTIADGAISASDSATLLIQTMKAYNMTASESERIIDSINEV